MLVSSNFLKSSYEKFKKNRQEKKIKEGYNAVESSMAGISASFDTFILVLAILFFILELLLLFYAITLALKCTKPGPERITHLVLAVIFTLPYVLFSSFFSKCAQDTLRGSDFFMSPLGRAERTGSPSGLSFI